MDAPFGESAVEMIRKSSISSVDTDKSDSSSSSSPSATATTTASSSSRADVLAKRVSTRDFFGGSSENLETWELVLSSGVQDDATLTQKPLDIVLLGHSNGYV